MFGGNEREMGVFRKRDAEQESERAREWEKERA